MSLDHGTGDISDSALSPFVSYSVSRSLEANVVHMSHVSCTVRSASVQGEHLCSPPRIKHSRTGFIYNEQRLGHVLDVRYNVSSTQIHHGHFLRHWIQRIHRRSIPRDWSPFARTIESVGRSRERVSAARPAPALTMYAEQNLE